MEHGDLAFLADVPAPSDGEFPTSRIQVGKLGNFHHQRWGKFLWTAATFASFVKNFRERSGGRIPIDPDHTPDKGGPTEAEGWITELHPEGDKLFATAEWTPQAAQKIRDRRYMFISPTFSMVGKGESGETIGPKMVGAALSNRPFLENMATVSLSADFSDEEIIELAQRTDLAREEAGDPSWDESKHPRGDAGTPKGGKFVDKGSSGKETEAVNKRLGVKGKTFGDASKKAVEAFQKKRGLKVDGVVGTQTVAALKGSKGAKSAKPGKLSDADTEYLRKGAPEGKRKVTAAAVEVLTTFSEPERAELLSLLSEVEDTSDSRARMAEPTFTAEQITGLATTFGLGENASPEDILTAAQAAQVTADDSQADDAELARRRAKAVADGDDDRVKGIDREKAKRAGKKTLANDEKVITADELTTLQADAAAGRQAAQTLDERDRNDTFTAAMDAGKVGDGSRVTFDILWESNRDGAKAFLDGLPAQVSTRPTGSSKQAAGETPEGVDPERYQLDQRAQAHMAEKGVDYETALFAVSGAPS